jgi:hypothetical protein
MIIAHLPLPLELMLDIIDYLIPHVSPIDSDEELRRQPQILRGSREMILEPASHNRYSDLKALRL